MILEGMGLGESRLPLCVCVQVVYTCRWVQNGWMRRMGMVLSNMASGLCAFI